MIKTGDVLFLFAITVSAILFINAFLWKKKHFIKEVYVDQAVMVVYVYVFLMIVEILPYVIVLRHQNFVSIYVLLCMILDFFILLMCISLMTTCVYLEKKHLIYKNMFVKKEINLINGECVVKEKLDRIIIVSNPFRINISKRHFVGNINNLLCQIRSIINH